ncbi:MAG TPA: hypothetical protein VEC38_01975 [Candidatus Binataceae bacterium]|nr:hypothetical protein [Candidatus Binataceae bacterium]
MLWSAKIAAVRRTRAIVVVAGMAAFSISVHSALHAQDAPAIRSQGGQTLEVAPVAPIAPAPQNPAPGASDDNTRVIPTIPPEDQVLVLPQASSDFLGKWGGHLTLTTHYGEGQPPADAIVSLMFGQREGHVVLATTVLGNADSQILDYHADTDGPRAVKLELSGLDISTRPPLRHVEKLTLALSDDNQIRCHKLVDIYLAGMSDPLLEAEYDGTLHTLTRREDRMLSEEVLRRGAVPRLRIEEGNPPPD